MKVCLFFENYENIKQSGVGKAAEHQKAALDAAGIEYTMDPNDDYDILHINTIFVKSLSTIKKARKKGAKIIYHAHSTPEDTRNSFIFSNLVTWFLKWYLKKLYNSADLVITPTPYSKNLLLNHGVNVPIIALSNGVNLNKFCPSDEKTKEFLDYFSLKENEACVVSAGLWIKRKGILDFIEVAKRMPEVKFIWFGYTNPKLIPRKIRNAIKTDHPKNCIFPGYMSGNVFEGAFSGASMFFFPSLEETEGIVILEALSSKTLTVTRDIPVYDGWMKDGVNCYKGHDIDDFVKIINTALSGDNRQIIENGYITAKERSIESVGKKLADIYHELYNKKEG